MLSITEIVLILIGLLIILLWEFLYISGRKYKELFDNLEENDYPLKEVYFVGYAAMELIHYGYKSKADRRLRREIEILYGAHYADYYMRVIYAQKVTMALTLLCLAVPIYALSGEMAAALIIVMFAGTAYYYFGTLTAENIKKRSEEMLSEFSEVVSKLALLTNAGMILREAWESVAYTGTGALYEEMKRTVNEMNNGVSEVDAFYEFGVRCVVPEIKKFTSTVVQGLVKGNSELALMMQQQSKELWAQKKQNARRQGELAASKLMIPIMIMFIGILIMVIVPIFTNL